jgi:hypothetical protein
MHRKPRTWVMCSSSALGQISGTAPGDAAKLCLAQDLCRLPHRPLPCNTGPPQGLEGDRESHPYRSLWSPVARQPTLADPSGPLLSSARTRCILERPSFRGGHMRSHMVRAGPWAVMGHAWALLLLVLMMAAKPDDWTGSRYGEWNTVPNNTWYQYKCRIPTCTNFFQSQDKPTYPIICERHEAEAIMRLDYDPTRG